MKLKKYKLSDLLATKTQGVNTTTDNIKYVDSGIRIIQAKNISKYEYTFDNENYVSEKTYLNMKENHKLHNGEVLFTNIGSQLGNSVVYDNEEPAIITWNVLKLIPNHLINNYFLCYYLNYKSNYIKTLNSSSTMPFVSGQVLLNIECEIPDLTVQEKIVKIVKTINDKIKLNNKINNHLYNISSALIEKEFKNNDLIKLNEVVTFFKGKKPTDISNDKKVGYMKYLTIACLNNQETIYAHPDKTLLTESDILMVMDGASSGDVYYSNKGIVGSTLSKIKVINDGFIPEYLYFVLKKYEKIIREKTTGSAIPHTDKVFVGNLNVPKIDKDKQIKYMSIIKKINENNMQKAILFQLRDTLLPKLMNGEIDLENIEI